MIFAAAVRAARIAAQDQHSVVQDPEIRQLKRLSVPYKRVLRRARPKITFPSGRDAIQRGADQARGPSFVD
jgi:hypothetical protein